MKLEIPVKLGQVDLQAQLDLVAILAILVIQVPVVRQDQPV